MNIGKLKYRCNRTKSAAYQLTAIGLNSFVSAKKDETRLSTHPKEHKNINRFAWCGYTIIFATPFGEVAQLVRASDS